MPMYEYKCHKCGQVFELIQKFSDEPLKVHDHCGGELEKLISTSALQFKGSGFYITDYAKSGSKSTASSKSNNDGGKSDSKGDSGSDSKSSSSSDSSSSSSGSSTTSTSTSTDTKK